MKTFSKISALFVLLAFLQSCIVSSSPNMEFLDRESLGKGAQVTAVNPPMFLVKPFIKKALREDGESEEVIALIKKVKKVRVMSYCSECKLSGKTETLLCRKQIRRMDDTEFGRAKSKYPSHYQWRSD